MQAFHDQKTDAINNQGNGNRGWIIEQFIDLIINQYTDNTNRYTGNGDLGP